MPERRSRQQREKHDAELRARREPHDAIVNDTGDAATPRTVEESPGERLESRDRNRRDESSGRDAMDDNVQLVDDDERLPADAVDELAAEPAPEDYETTPDGERRPHNDDAEMGLGGEPRSADELADRALGDSLRTRRGTTRDGEVHGEDLGRT